MARVERFEELLAWRRARELAALVFEAASELPFARDFGLKDQANRSAAPVAANIAEGFERGSRAEFAQFLSIAKGSCGELRSHIYLAKDRGYLSDADFERLMHDAEDVGRIVGALRAAVAKQRDEAKARRPTQSSVLSPQS